MGGEDDYYGHQLATNKYDELGMHDWSHDEWDVQCENVDPREDH